MALYTIPAGCNYSTFMPKTLKESPSGFTIEWNCTETAKYKALSSDIQKIGGVGFDMSLTGSKTKARLGYRTIDHTDKELMDGKYELHMHLDEKGKYVVQPSKIMICDFGVDYYGEIILIKSGHIMVYIYEGNSRRLVMRKMFSFRWVQKSFFGIGGCILNPYFEDEGTTAPHYMSYYVDVQPMYNNYENAPL